MYCTVKPSYLHNLIEPHVFLLNKNFAFFSRPVVQDILEIYHNSCLNFWLEISQKIRKYFVHKLFDHRQNTLRIHKVTLLVHKFTINTVIATKQFFVVLFHSFETSACKDVAGFHFWRETNFTLGRGVHWRNWD